MVGTRCDPKLTVGNEIVRALPRPSSSETLTDCNDASMGNTAVVSKAGRVFVTKLARSLLKSIAVTCRFGFGASERSTLRRGGAVWTATVGATTGVDKESVFWGSSRTGADGG